MWTDDLLDVDAQAPIEWTLTGAGFLGTLQTVTGQEAAEMLDVHPGSVTRLACRGVLRGVRVGGCWLLDRASVEATSLSSLRRPRTAAVPVARRLPAGPLLALVDGRGGPRRLGVPRGSADDMALYRAHRNGTITERAGDRIVVEWLGLTSWEVWGEAG